MVQFSGSDVWRIAKDLQVYRAREGLESMKGEKGGE